MAEPIPVTPFEAANRTFPGRLEEFTHLRQVVLIPPPGHQIHVVEVLGPFEIAPALVLLCLRVSRCAAKAVTDGLKWAARCEHQSDEQDACRGGGLKRPSGLQWNRYARVSGPETQYILIACRSFRHYRR